MRQGSHGKPARVLGSFNLLTLPCFRSKQACMCSSRAESRFLTTPLSVSLVFKTSKGTRPPGVKPQAWGTQYVVLTTHSPQKISEPIYYPSSSGPPRGAVPNLIAFFVPTQFLCGSFLQPFKIYLLISNKCQKKETEHEKI